MNTELVHDECIATSSLCIFGLGYCYFVTLTCPRFFHTAPRNTTNNKWEKNDNIQTKKTNKQKNNQQQYANNQTLNNNDNNSNIDGVINNNVFLCYYYYSLANLFL